MAATARRIHFKAYRANGEIETGAIEARDEQEAARLLRQSGRIPFELSATGPGAVARSRPRLELSSGPDLSRLFGDLSVMLGSGFTIDVALRAVSEAATDKALARAASSVHTRISEGQSISAAFGAIPEIPPDVAALLASGESSGRLDMVVASLAETYARGAARRREVSEALLYPAFLIVVMFGAFLLLALYLAPALRPVFENAGVEPPRLVRWLSGFGDFLSANTVTLALAAAIALGLVFLGIRAPRIRALAGEVTLHIPGLAGFRRSAAVGRYLNTMALLLGNGVPMLDAMRLGADTAATASGRTQLLGARQAVADGRGFWQALGGSQQFPDFVVSLVRLGEQSDNLAPMLGRAGAIVEAQLQRRITRLLTFLTPAITLTLGLVIGGLVVSVMTTLLSINEIALQ